MNGIRAAGVADAVPPTWILQTGGIAALLLAAGYLATIPLFAIVGAPPEGAQARLEYHMTGTTAWWGIVALSVLTDLLFVPVAISLYTALRRSNQPAMLIATAFTLLFVVLDLAVLWPAKASLVTLGEAYAAATSDQRVLLLAAAGYPSAVLDSSLTAVYSILTLSIGILGTGLVMLRGGFGPAPALVGVTSEVLGIASVMETAVTGRFPILVVGASLLTIMWLVLVGRGLIRYFGPVPDALYPDAVSGVVLRIDPERTRASDSAHDLAALGGQE